MDNESPKNSTANEVECDALLAVRLLRIRSLIADKEMVTARANLDLQRGGDWCQDYQEWHRQIDLGIEAEIDALQSAANDQRKAAHE